jgi:hypothetical protein
LAAAAKAGAKVEALPPEDRRAKGPIGQLLAAAQGESVKGAMDAGQDPVECRVLVDGNEMGVYKGKSTENLERIIRFRMEESHLSAAVQVIAYTAENV